jgi:hypothetical protein
MKPHLGLVLLLATAGCDSSTADTPGGKAHAPPGTADADAAASDAAAAGDAGDVIPDAGDAPTLDHQLDPRQWTQDVVVSACRAALACDYYPVVGPFGSPPGPKGPWTVYQCITGMLNGAVFPEDLIAHPDTLLAQARLLECGVALTQPRAEGDRSPPCAAFIACVSAGVGASACKGTTEASAQCDGAVAAVCRPGDEKPYAVRDCGAIGQECHTTADAKVATCSTSTKCGRTGDTLCEADGTTLSYCNETGYLAPVECGASPGWTCEGVGRAANCSGPGASCLIGSGRCDGDLPVRCAGLNDQVAREAPAAVECSAVGGHCVERPSGPPFCEPDATECDGETEETCDGQDVVVACGNGNALRIDCASYGRKCATRSERPTAYCE